MRDEAAQASSVPRIDRVEHPIGNVLSSDRDGARPYTSTA
jgi:hypothetical protein